MRSSVFYTPQDYHYNHAWRTVQARSSVSFKVRACNDAHVLFAKTQGVTTIDAYELLIGGWSNTKSVLRDRMQGEPLASVQLAGIVSCSQARWFWASWDLGKLRFGLGRYAGERQLLMTDIPYSPDSVGLSTGGNSNGTWEFTSTSGTLPPANLYRAYTCCNQYSAILLGIHV